MNPASKTAVATMNQIGRRLSSSYAYSSRSGLGRVADLIGSVRSNHSEETKKQMLTTTGAPLAQSSHQIIQGATAQTRTKSSMAIAYDEPQVQEAAPANAMYDQSVREPFPSIVLGPEKSVEPQGSFAEAQAEVRKIYQRTAIFTIPDELNRMFSHDIRSSLILLFLARRF